MSEPFRRTFHARWGEMDFNRHLKNTGYLDICGDVRMLFFAEQGYPMREFERLRLGPVIVRDELEYFRELRLLDRFEVTLAAGGASEDRSRFRLVNEFRRENGQLVARVTSTGGWMDHRTRRLVAPPDSLREALERLPRSDDFVVLDNRRGR